MFFNILYIYSKTGTTDYELLLQIQLTKEDQLFRWLTFFIAFAAKIPLFPLHIWLPEAHVEAPTIGSVLLAVLRLKLGVYGLIRFCIPLFPEGTSFFCTNSYNFCLYWNYLYLSNSKTSNWSKKNYCIFIGRSYKCSSTWNYNRNKRKSTRSYFSKTKSWSRFWFSFFLCWCSLYTI